MLKFIGTFFNIQSKKEENDMNSNPVFISIKLPENPEDCDWFSIKDEIDKQVNDKKRKQEEIFAKYKEIGIVGLAEYIISEEEQRSKEKRSEERCHFLHSTKDLEETEMDMTMIRRLRPADVCYRQKKSGSDSNIPQFAKKSLFRSQSLNANLPCQSTERGVKKLCKVFENPDKDTFKPTVKLSTEITNLAKEMTDLNINDRGEEDEQLEDPFQ